MKDFQAYLRKEIKRFLPQAQKNITILNRDTKKLMKKTEKNLLETYAKTKEATEAFIFKAQREKLYYELGKVVLPVLSDEQLKNKRIAPTVREIKKLNRMIRSKK